MIENIFIIVFIDEDFFLRSISEIVRQSSGD